MEELVYEYIYGKTSELCHQNVIELEGSSFQRKHRGARKQIPPLNSSFRGYRLLHVSDSLYN